MLTEIWEVVLEDLLEKLQDLFHLAIVKAEEWHDREFSDEVAECDECLVLIHV